MSTEDSSLIKVVSKFLDPKSAKIGKLKEIDDILKLDLDSYKFIDKEETTIMKQLLDVSTIEDASKLNKDDPFESLTQIEETDDTLELAIDFAADTAGAGSVVVHTGEWERALTDMYIDDPTGKINLSYDEKDRLLFKRRQQEPHDAIFLLLDDRTSQKMETVQKDRLVSVPKWKRPSTESVNGLLMGYFVPVLLRFYVFVLIFSEVKMRTSYSNL